MNQIIRRYEESCDFLKKNKLRYSRQRMVVINELFFSGERKHFKVNDLLKTIKLNHSNVNISNASLTNILKGLCKAGHIKEIYINKPYYDIVTEPHLHLYDNVNEELIDIENDGYLTYISDKISLPEGYKVEDVSCVVNIAKL